MLCKNFKVELRIFLLLVLAGGMHVRGFAQLTGNKYIPGDYATIAAAVTALNSNGVGAGGVTFHVAANHTETITATISMTATGTLANPVVFQKNPLTVGNNPLITAHTTGVGTPASATQDGIWRFIGSDYVTINGIDLTENAANTTNPSTMEYGYALYKTSTTDACQYMTIRNCTVTLSTVNNALGTSPMVDGSCGILVINSTYNAATTALSPTTGGQASYNKFYSNTIKNCNTGIALIGYAASSPFTRADAFNDVGGSSLATGNNIVNFGGAAAAANPTVGIRTLAQYDINISYNTINSNNGAGTNHPNIIRGILNSTATSANCTISYNTVTVKGGGTTQHIYGIDNASGSTAASNTVNITNNTVTGCSYTTATTGGFYGINNSGGPATLNITNNTVTNDSISATGAGFLYGFLNSGTATVANINNNSFTNNYTGSAVTGLHIAFYPNSTGPTVNYVDNNISNNIVTSTAGVFYGFYGRGTVTGSITYDGNIFGLDTIPAVRFTANNVGAQILLYNSRGGTAATLNITDNVFHRPARYPTGITGAGSCTLMSNAATMLNHNVTGNVFHVDSINNSGSFTFMSLSGAVSAGGTQTVSNNATTANFVKAVKGGTVTVFTGSATNGAGATITHSNNNFSNMTVVDTAVMTGWVITDAGTSTIHVTENNTFSNWTGKGAALTGMTTSVTSANNATRNNVIYNFTNAGTITGIASGTGGNDSIYSNRIYGFTTITAAAATGISVTGGTAKSVFRNKIYDLQASILGGTVNGISVSGTTSAVVTAYVYNNTIGDLRTPLASAADPVRGISLTSTRANSSLYVYYNTIYLSATSSGTNFGTTGIYHSGSATQTTAQLTLANNIVANYSTANGTGLVVAFRRATTSLSNYSTSSNNNIFYSGTPGTKNLIYYDATNSDQTINAFKARVTTRETNSLTEDISNVFLSLVGSSSNFLHLNPAIATQAESGALAVGILRDYDNNLRQGDTSYTGTGTAPDIGADEFEGIRALPLSGTYTVGVGGNYTSLTKTGGLFAALNSLGVNDDVEVNIISDLSEDGANALNQWEEHGTGTHSVTIQPSAAVTRVISGNVATALIRLNGADRLEIDGSFGTSNRYLTFRNTNTAGATGTAFTFINGASNNIINRCNIEAYANATNGVVLFSTTIDVAGNNSNTISNCNINGTVSANTSNVAIYSAGTALKENSSNILSGNNIYDYRDRGIDISATGNTLWTITGNSLYNGAAVASVDFASASASHAIRILGGAGHTITNNYIGGTAALAGGTQAAYSSTLGLHTYTGILLTTTAATPASNIKGNTVANIAVSGVPTANNTIIFNGIETTGSGINIGGTSTGEGNTIGSATTNGSISITTSTPSNASLRTLLRGINCTSTGGQVIANQVAGFDINNQGATPSSSAFTGINISVASAPSQVNSNIIGSATVANSIRVVSGSIGVSTGLVGISLTSTVASTVQVDANTIRNMSILTTAAVATSTLGNVTGILSAATGAASITISNNTVRDLYHNIFTAGTLYGIRNSGAATTLNITGNTIVNNSTNSTASTGIYNAIANSGAVVTTLNINNNLIGTSSVDALVLNAANAAPHIFINNTAGATTCALSISNNTFRRVNYAVAGTGSCTFILNSAAALTQAINGNIFADLSLATSGAVTFISNSVAVSATGTQNVNNNSISGTFAKTVAGTATVTVFTSSGATASGGVVNNSNNNFSNITVLGATPVSGWVRTDAGAGEKNVVNNTFSNWTGATGLLTGMSVSLSGSNSHVSDNIISNFTSTGAITGITTGAGEDYIHNNTIFTLSTTGASAVSGIAVTAGTTKRIYKNKIYDLQSNSATGTVNGILMSGATVGGSVTVYNNLIGDLRAPSTSSTSDAIRGLSVTATTATSTFNIYYNTVYLNATSTGTNFHTSAVYHAGSATATTATLNLRNNSLTNISTPKGSGVTAVLRRGTTSTFANHASTSNNNLMYAGTPGTTRLIYYFNSGTADQTITAFQTRATPAETASVTEDLTTTFLSTTGSSALFLHINNLVPTIVESGGANITGFTDDYDAQVRQGNPGYSGSGYAPDIGADEIFGLEVIPPAISYTALSNTTSTSNPTLSSVTITDGSGVNTTAGTKPRIYYKRFTDANTFVDNTSSTNGWKYTEATNSSSPFSFTINYALLYGGATATAGVIQYFVTAQDVATPANVAINSGVFTVDPASVALTSTAFPITGTINSYQIPFSGSIEIGSGKPFNSLTKSDGVFSSINTVGLMATTTLSITSDLTEDAVTALNQWTESGAGNYQLIIKSDNEVLKTISGDGSSGLIRLNGADRVRVDGSVSGNSPYLLFRNTNTGGGAAPAFSFTNGATYDTIRYSTIEAYTGSTSGVVAFGTTSSSGNSNNTIEYNTINATVSGNTGNTGIYSSGTSGQENSTNKIANNSIANFGYNGLHVTATGNTGWTVSGNSFYNGTVSDFISYPASSAIYGIRILGGADYQVLNNYIGGNSASAGGTNAVHGDSTTQISVTGILLTTSGGTSSAIKGNTITRLTVNSAPQAANAVLFTGIETNGTSIDIGGTSVGEGNMVGSNSSIGSIIVSTTTTSATNTSLVRGIICNATGTKLCANQVGGIDIGNVGTTPAGTQFTGIYVTAASPPAQITSNIIGSYGTGAVSNSLRVRNFSAAQDVLIRGIVLGSSVASTINLSSNIINNVAVNSSTSSGTFYGILNSASSSAFTTISSNRVSTITTFANTSTNSAIYTGIETSSPADITANIIDNMSLLTTGSNSQIRGIYATGNFSFNISTDTISRLYAASTHTANIQSANPDAYTIIGILDHGQGGSHTIANNLLYDLRSTTTTAINTTVAGIATFNGAGNIYRNRMTGFLNTATGTSIVPGIGGLVIAGGGYTVYNNAINISNSAGTNALRIYGMMQSSTSASSYYYNTVSVSGSAAGTSARTAAFIRTDIGGVTLRNNIFANSRTGVGTHFGMSNIASTAATGWSASASDYNDMASATATNTGEWGSGNNVNLASWKSASGGDAHSYDRAVTFLTSTYDLVPDGATNCALDNTATPITSPLAISTDMNSVSRHATTPDMGAYEFSYTPFSIDATSNSPVCAGGDVALSADPGAAVKPAYSWRNPLLSVVATTQTPNVTAYAGYYELTVTDGGGCIIKDSTLVATITRPTGAISGGDSICNGSSITLNLAVTGTGTIEGELNTGESFTGTAPLITVNVTPSVTTTYAIAEMSDNNCSVLPQDVTDTELVSVIHEAIWTGAVSTDWYNAANWRCGAVPDDETDVIIRVATRQPVISTGTAAARGLDMVAGTSLTLSSNLEIYGTLSGTGTTTATSGHVSLKGSAAQSVPSGFFATNTIKDLSVDNSAGVTLLGNLSSSGTVKVTSGTLSSGGYLTLLSTAGGTALIDGSGAGSVTGNVTMQRYLSSAKGYKYISSPFTSATVAQFSQEVDLEAEFPMFYEFDEDVDASGWLDYTDEAGTLTPLLGYAANFSDTTLSETISITGVVNNGNISLPSIYNHDQPYTQGFHLVGNPYPSPVNWNAVGGWTRTNVDNAVYYFNAGTATRFTGTYSSYINGVSSDGVASNIIPSMQGFFVHVSDGTYPVTGALAVNNTARVNNLTPVFHRTTGEEPSVMRLQLVPEGDTVYKDQMAIYFNEDATAAYDKELDALKLMNTDEQYPNMYAYSSDMEKLSISSVASPGFEDRVIPLEVSCNKGGHYNMVLSSWENMPEGVTAFLADRLTGNIDNISVLQHVPVTLSKGTSSKRFFVVFSKQEKVGMPAASNDAVAFVNGNSLFVLAEHNNETLHLYNVAGQEVVQQPLRSNGFHEIKLGVSAGVYIVTITNGAEQRMRKVVVSR